VPRLGLDGFIVRLRARSGGERLGHEQSSHVLEVGYPGATTVHAVAGGMVKERGRMVACTLSWEDQIADALHAVADLYASHRKTDAQTQERIIVGG
jgi:hypothetical protein